MHLSTYLGLLHSSEQTLADALRCVADGHAAEPDVVYACGVLATFSDRHVAALLPVVERYSMRSVEEPERLRAATLTETRSGGVGLLRDLQDCYLLATMAEMTWTVVGQAAQALRDAELMALVASADRDTTRQLRWLRTRMKQAAPQALVVAT